MLQRLFGTYSAQAIKSKLRRTALPNFNFFTHTSRKLRLSTASSLLKHDSSLSFHSSFLPHRTVAPEVRRLLVTAPRCNSRVAECKEEDNHLTIKFSDEIIAKFHYIWLRDHCPCDECYHPITFQRQLDTQEIPLDIKPKSVSKSDGAIHVEWPNGHISCYPYDWLYEHRYGQPYECYDIKEIKKHLWNVVEYEDVKDSNFKEVMEDDEKLLEFLEKLVKYGLVMIDGLEEPYNKSLTDLGNRIGHVQRTHYGDVWTFTSGNVEFADTAYLFCKLECHNDGTYFYESPGLQLLHCNYHTGDGGENVFVDGFHVADQLKQKDLDAFEFLAKTKIPSFYYEKDSYLFKAYDTIIKLGEFDKEIYQIRFNSNDRDVLSCLSFEDVEKFYKASHCLTDLIRQPANELVIKPKPGRAALFDNWRVFHARNGFTGERSMTGYYVQRNTFLSRVLSLREKLSKE